MSRFLAWKPRTILFGAPLGKSGRKLRNTGPAKIAYSDTDKSEIIADSLQNQFKLNNITNDTDRAITHVVHNFQENENNFTNIPPTPPPTQGNYRVYR
ncbi:hypothetical protein TNCV_1300741 [Trichonephila clavipes]|nr:hypothetical protein TNCV_1300741 [Trichonephila clavipes]